MLTRREVQALLGAHGLRLTKRLGQHHLIDPRVIAKIVEACEPLDGATVVEIGPGLGALTERLAGRARRVVAVEVDRGIAALLGKRLRELGNVEVRCEDILQFSWEPFRHAVAVGAIPYHITSPILVSLCGARASIDRAVLVIQEEVARRLAAPPATKAYGRLSVLVQYGWEVALDLGVPRGAFFPPPGVASRCVRLSRRSRPPAEVADEPLFFEVVKAAFSERRKTLANALRNLPGLRLSRPEVQELLALLRLPAAIRGEALSLEQFAALTNALGRCVDFDNASCDNQM